MAPFEVLDLVTGRPVGGAHLLGAAGCLLLAVVVRWSDDTPTAHRASTPASTPAPGADTVVATQEAGLISRRGSVADVAGVAEPERDRDAVPAATTVDRRRHVRDTRDRDADGIVARRVRIG